MHLPVWPFWTAGLAVRSRLRAAAHRAAALSPARGLLHEEPRVRHHARARTELGFAPTQSISTEGIRADGRSGTRRLQRHCLMSRLNIVHVCDHLGWEGSRMHGVKRLFAWMIPRFDRDALQRVARQPAPEGSVGGHARAVRHRRDLSRAAQVRSRTYPALLQGARSASSADVVHMHGYGATTFGRLCARRLGIPAILHEHANHTDTPWFQKVADRLLAPHTDLAIAVSESTAEFTMRARLVPAERTKVVYLGSPLDEFARPRSADEIAAARAALGIAAGDDRRRHRHAADAVEGQPVPGRGRARDRPPASAGARVHRRRRRAAGGARGAGAGARSRRSTRASSASSATSPRC